MKKERFSFLLIAFFFLTLFLQNSVLYAEKGELNKSQKRWREYFQRGREKGSSVEKKAEYNDREELNPEGMVDLVDSPTSNIIDYGGYRLNFRLFSNGGVTNHISFGVFRRLNIGASWDVEKVIGTEDPSMNVPSLNIKFRVSDGTELLPSLAIGYDGQGRFFDKSTDQYKERERGLFMVFGREIFIPKLESYGGINIAQFKEGIVLGFVALSYTIEEKVALMTEYDHIRTASNNRWNIGVRIFPIPSLGIDFAVRHVGSNQDKERVVRINYVGSF